MFSFLNLFQPKQQPVASIQESELNKMPEADQSLETNKGKEYFHVWIDEKDYELKECFWDGKNKDGENREAFIYKIIMEHISEYYYCFPHVSLREIFKMKEGADKYNLRFLAPFHVDYLFVTKEKGFPIMAVELDGIWHDISEDQKKADKFKNAIFKGNEIPLIHMKIENMDKESVCRELLELLSKDKLYNEKNAPVYCKKCGRRMGIQERKDGTGKFYYCVKCKGRNGKNFTTNLGQISDIMVSK